MAPTIRPRRSMSSRAAVSSDTTIAKNITVTAMYQEVAIQLATSDLSRKGMAPMRVADIEQEQQQQQRHENQPQPQAGGKEDDGGDQRHQLVGAGFDEDDRAGCADQPHQRALQREHARRGRHGWRKSPAVAAYAITHSQTYATQLTQRRRHPGVQ